MPTATSTGQLADQSIVPEQHHIEIIAVVTAARKRSPKLSK
jgi:hypothetical protein